MAFALYIFSEGKWTESKILSQKNIALIIDPQAKNILIWEGLLTSVQDQYNAQMLLTQIKVQYSDYKFRTMPKHPSEEIQQYIDNALKDTEEVKQHLVYDAKQLDNVQKIQSIISIILLLSAIIYILLKLDTPTYTASNTKEYFNFDQQDLILFFILTTLALISNIGLMIMNAVIALTQKYYWRFIIFSGLVIFTLLILVVYWNTQFLAFSTYLNIFQNSIYSVPKATFTQFVIESTIFLGCLIVLSVLAFINHRIGYLIHLTK